MIIIYDFDGTLTPYSMPKYEIIKKCGYDDNKLKKRISEVIKTKSIGLYEAYYTCYKDILKENNIEMAINNICLKADNVKFNTGVIEYLNNFQYKNTGVKHYIVTSGIKDYIEHTKISKFVDGIFGVTLKKVNNNLLDINSLLTDDDKVNTIKKIQTLNNNTNEIIYMGDGLTDRFAFEYIHNIGGINIFIASNDQSKEIFNEINNKNIIDEYFEADFRLDSKLSKYIKMKIENIKS